MITEWLLEEALTAGAKTCIAGSTKLISVPFFLKRGKKKRSQKKPDNNICCVRVRDVLKTVG